jgi:hypothetical protein
MNTLGEPWFKPKTYGYGNAPCNWKGWAATIGFIVFVCGLVLAVQDGRLAPTWAVAIGLIATILFIGFSKAKTAGEWRWRWGDDRG